MPGFLRFETELRCEVTNRPLGIFWASERVEESATLGVYARERIRESIDWYNRNLIAPQLGDRD